MSLINKIKKTYYKIVLKHKVKSCGKVLCMGKINILNNNIEICDNVVLYPGVSFEGNGLIQVGKNVKIGTNTIISAHENGGISIGDNTIIAGNSYIIDCNHRTEKKCIIASQYLDAAKLEIGSDVWIGANVSVLKGSKIKNGAVIGAGAVVNKTIESYGIAVGSPAKVIKYRS